MSNLYLVYRGASSFEAYSAYYDGSKWYGNTKIEDQPGGIDPEFISVPDMAVWPSYNRLYLAYVGILAGELFADLRTAYFDGNSWHGNTKIEDQPGGISPKSNTSPGAVIYNNRLYLVYKGDLTDNLYSAYYDGTKWYGNTKIEDQPGRVNPDSNKRPGLAVYNNKMYVAYKGADSNDLYTAYYDGTSWYGNTKIADQPGGISPRSNEPPRAIVYNNRLYIIYKGASSNELYTAYYDGVKWYGNTKIADQPGGLNPQSRNPVGAAVYNGLLYLAYKGASSGALYTAYYDKAKWYGNKKIKDQPGGIDPETFSSPAAAAY